MTWSLPAALLPAGLLAAQTTPSAAEGAAEAAAGTAAEGAAGAAAEVAAGAAAVAALCCSAGSAPEVQAQEQCLAALLPAVEGLRKQPWGKAPGAAVGDQHLHGQADHLCYFSLLTQPCRAAVTELICAAMYMHLGMHMN